MEKISWWELYNLYSTLYIITQNRGRDMEWAVQVAGMEYIKNAYTSLL